MRYAGIIKNDTAAGPGLCLSVYTQGCDCHCPGCHNPQTWDFNGGREFTNETLKEIIENINANGILRPLCILGGEPLHPNNQFLTRLIIEEVKRVYPQVPVYIWTGYIAEELRSMTSAHLTAILSNTDVLIDGPFIEAQRDITLLMRGSTNQRILNCQQFFDINKKI